MKMGLQAQLGSLFLVLFLVGHAVHVHAGGGKFETGEWKHAHGTHYEGSSDTFGGACGYHDVVKEGYGLETVALSNALFNKGEMCGACFEIKCEDSPQWCKPGQPSLIVTATNQCPPNPAQDPNNGGWCNEPREHFDIARPVFEKIAEYKAGIVPVSYRRIPCDHKEGGIKFTLTGNPYFTEVLVWNVAGAGDVSNVEVQTEEHPDKWLPMERMWGQRWVYNGKLCESQGALSFKVTSGDGRSVISEKVAPKGWELNKTYEGKNFDVPSFKPGPWKHAHATFYEGGSGSFGGACGYHDVVQEGYGLDTVAISDTLFNDGQSCGACYDIQCVDSPQWCKPGQPTLHVTATNHCPPNYNLPSDNGGRCNAPHEHFDIAKPVFLHIAEYKAGIVPIIYRRVPCQKKGGIRFTITGNPYYNEVLVWNVAGAGDVVSVQVKGDDKLKWTAMKRMWGQRWITDARLVGESLTFRVEVSDKRRSTSWHTAPKNWQFGQTFEGKNFR